MRQVIIYPGEDGYWVAECPSLPGCVSQGKSKEEVIANIREATFHRLRWGPGIQTRKAITRYRLASFEAIEVPTSQGKIPTPR